MPVPIKVHTDEICGTHHSGPAVVTVGTFDGVHVGHRAILQRLDAAAQGEQMRTVVTFDPHPQAVIRREGKSISVLSDAHEKTELLCAYGVDRTYTLVFDHHLAQLSAEEFVQEILLNRLHTSRLVVGYNHSFGRNREGNFEFLEKNLGRFGFELEVVGPYYLQGEIVSSTKIRRLLEAGDIEKANLFLGRPYALAGKVVAGAGRGRSLGFPTANLESTSREKLIPHMGVYAVAVRHENQLHPGMLSIGVRPTFGSGAATIEVHLINFDNDLYGQVLQVHFLARLRDEERYRNAQELQRQMSKDREKSLQVFQKYNSSNLAL